MTDRKHKYKAVKVPLPVQWSIGYEVQNPTTYVPPNVVERCETCGGERVDERHETE